MALDLAKYNIRVNSVCPNIVLTPRTKKYFADKKYNKYVKENTFRDYQDHSIIKINKKGETLFEKSVTEILIENKIFDINLRGVRICM